MYNEQNNKGGGRRRGRGRRVGEGGEREKERERRRRQSTIYFTTLIICINRKSTFYILFKCGS